MKLVVNNFNLDFEAEWEESQVSVSGKDKTANINKENYLDVRFKLLDIYFLYFEFFTVTWLGF